MSNDSTQTFTFSFLKYRNENVRVLLDIGKQKTRKKTLFGSIYLYKREVLNLRSRVTWTTELNLSEIHCKIIFHITWIKSLKNFNSILYFGLSNFTHKHLFIQNNF